MCRLRTTSLPQPSRTARFHCERSAAIHKPTPRPAGTPLARGELTAVRMRATPYTWILGSSPRMTHTKKSATKT